MNDTTSQLLVGAEPATSVYDTATTCQLELNPDSNDPRTQARAAFVANPGKCFQRHLCEARGELEAKPKITKPIKDAQVELITNQQAATIIKKYEYLATMATATRASFGLFLDGELLGVACFAAGTGSPESLRLTTVPPAHPAGAGGLSSTRSSARSVISHSSRLSSCPRTIRLGCDFRLQRSGGWRNWNDLPSSRLAVYWLAEARG
jgi:hypothetical protein